MPTAKKLPSGSWRCQVFSHYETLPDGNKKRIYESFTCDDPGRSGKRKAEFLAAQFAEGRKTKNRETYRYTFGDALGKYIEERTGVLSPASIRKYKSMERNCMVPLKDYKLSDLTEDIIQNIINTAALEKSPKTVRDMNGLIMAVMNRYRPELRLQIALPKKLRPDIYVPSEDEIKRLLGSVEDTQMEVPVMLAAFGAMRRGEICAFSRKADLKKNSVHITKTMVMNPESEWIIKAPKSYAGDRYVTFPDFVVKKIKKMPRDTVGLTPNELSNRFKTVLKHANLPHFRFHDLRHYNASIQHALGIPDAYIMQSGGWGNDSVLKEVYRHALPEVQDKMTNKALNHFESMQHEMQHEMHEP